MGKVQAILLRALANHFSDKLSKEPPSRLISGASRIFPFFVTRCKGFLRIIYELPTTCLLELAFSRRPVPSLLILLPTALHIWGLSQREIVHRLAMRSVLSEAK